MSFSNTCAKVEHDTTRQAVAEDDTEALYKYVDLAKKMGEDE